MGRKIFVSYKHSDDSVKSIGRLGTARDYVDHLEDLFETDDNIYKGEEGDEDLSYLTQSTITEHLREKIRDSSITVVLISPNMKDSKRESDQWIPWEVSYSLRETVRTQGSDQTSHPNGILAVTLPDIASSCRYFIEENICPHCNARTLQTGRLFQILRDNMFNVKSPTFTSCGNHPPKTIYQGYSSYIHSVKWDDFVSDKDRYLEIAAKIRDEIDDYDITKVIEGGTG